MSLRTKTLAALLTAVIAVPATSFAYWIPDNSEQGGTEVVDWSNMKSRAQVLEELEQAKADPSWATRQGEETGTWSMAGTEQTKSRAEVRQELESMSAKEKAYIESFYTGA
ncbi:DUF4148 domain-containing protein [Paenalcaligenes niemegkensis]|uniref:DUF4148 domain-containing protein n=1 Tax=Paenalcaligenes niemegkensis TaxID=2895469 RepID=UPI001EE8AACA|nr:DUF4148 domain-containing protein [Paenalcaligenes niemegkensis]MCQ9617322.1 DUF4148 domain-containing protein [Paenalcaligenes niemegkensis]